MDSPWGCEESDMTEQLSTHSIVDRGVPGSLSFPCWLTACPQTSHNQEFFSSHSRSFGFPGSSAGKNPPATQETLGQFLGLEVPLEKGQASHSTIYELVAQLVKNPPAMWETWVFNPWFGKIPWRRDRLPTSVFMNFPGGSDGKEFACNAGDLGLIPGLRRSLGGRHCNPLQYSYLENLHGQRSLALQSTGLQRVTQD